MSEENQVAEAECAESAAAEKAERISFKGCKIFKNQQENPRRPGSLGFAAWELLQDGMTFDEYLAAGGGGNHLRWDWDHGLVRIVDMAGDDVLPNAVRPVKVAKPKAEAKAKKPRKSKAVVADSGAAQEDLTQAA